MKLADKTILITGAASGIGRATALRMAAEGARLALADRDAPGLEAVLRDAGLDEARGLTRVLDVRDEAAVAELVQEVRRRLGRLDGLVNAAGILQGAFQPVDALETAVFERVLDVNLLGTFLCCKHAVPLMEETGGGVVLCIASGGGVRGPSSSLAYGASKAGIAGFCLTLERQLAPRGIRVNVVCPGALDTPMKRQNVRDGAVARGEDPDAALAATPLGDPDGVARVLTWLMSDEADYVTGTLFTR